MMNPARYWPLVLRIRFGFALVEQKKGKSKKQIPCGNDSQKGKSKTQIPCGNDSQKGKSKKQRPSQK